MRYPTAAEIAGRRRIIVADEDPAMVSFIIEVLRQDGCAVFHAYDGLSATELAFAIDDVDLVITNTRVNGVPGVALIHTLRERRPELPILYIANNGRSTPAMEAQLPANVPILRDPFSAQQLRAVVGQLISGKRTAALLTDHER